MQSKFQAHEIRDLHVHTHAMGGLLIRISEGKLRGRAKGEMWKADTHTHTHARARAFTEGEEKRRERGHTMATGNKE